MHSTRTTTPDDPRAGDDIAKIASRLIPMGVLGRAADLLRILGHPTRLRIIQILSIHPVTPKIIAKQLGLADNAVSQHLKLMLAHRILTHRRDGRNVQYELAGSTGLRQCLTQVVQVSQGSSPRSRRADGADL